MITPTVQWVFYVERAEAHWNLRVLKLRSDNGREYVNIDVTKWCKKRRRRRIEMDTMIPYTPQLNGRAEKLNRTLMEKTRALLVDSGMNKEMWGEALYTSEYILNRSPTEPLKTTLYEMWEKRKPNMQFLQTYSAGCIAHAKILKALKKLEKRSEKLTFVGYAPNGHRLWNSKRRKIFVTRDVRFGKTESESTLKEDSRRARLYFHDYSEETKEDSGSETQGQEETRIQIRQTQQQKIKKTQKKKNYKRNYEKW